MADYVLKIYQLHTNEPKVVARIPFKLIKWHRHWRNGYWYLFFGISIPIVTNQCLPMGKSIQSKRVSILKPFLKWKSYSDLGINSDNSLCFAVAILASVLQIIPYYTDMQMYDGNSRYIASYRSFLSKIVKQ